MKLKVYYRQAADVHTFSSFQLSLAYGYDDQQHNIVRRRVARTRSNFKHSSNPLPIHIRKITSRNSIHRGCRGKSYELVEKQITVCIQYTVFEMDVMICGNMRSQYHGLEIV